MTGVRKRVSGFTLIELLVVISIIALLLAILMPALSRVKEKAQQLVCRTNLHQWYLAHLNYAGENGSKMMESYGWLNANGLRDNPGAWPVEMVFDSEADSSGSRGTGAASAYASILSQSRIRPYIPGFNDLEMTYDDVMNISNIDSTEARSLTVRGAWKCPANRSAEEDTFLQDFINRIQGNGYFRTHYTFFYGADRFNNAQGLDFGCTDYKEVSCRSWMSGRQILMADRLYISDYWNWTGWNHGIFGYGDDLLSRYDDHPMSGLNRLMGDGSALWKDRKAFDTKDLAIEGDENPRVAGWQASCYY